MNVLFCKNAMLCPTPRLRHKCALARSATGVVNMHRPWKFWCDETVKHVGQVQVIHVATRHTPYESRWALQGTQSSHKQKETDGEI
jgi:hypothetical protein